MFKWYNRRVKAKKNGVEDPLHSFFVDLLESDPKTLLTSTEANLGGKLQFTKIL